MSGKADYLARSGPQKKDDLAARFGPSKANATKDLTRRASKSSRRVSKGR